MNHNCYTSADLGNNVAHSMNAQNAKYLYYTFTLCTKKDFLYILPFKSNKYNVWFFFKYHIDVQNTNTYETDYLFGIFEKVTEPTDWQTVISRTSN